MPRDHLKPARPSLPISHVVENQDEAIGFLGDPATHGNAVSVQRIDTHGAVVFLAGEVALKLKRAVRFPFMDLSTVAKRRRACKKEIAVNKAYAPQIYLDAVPITRRGDKLQLGGEGPAVDWVVRMRRFDETRTLDRLAEAGELDAVVLAATAQAVLASHRRAPVREGQEAALSLKRYIQQNDEALRESPHLFPGGRVAELTQASAAAFDTCYPLLIARGKAGFVRRCHGDLHLRNIAMIDGRPTLFDAIEFDEAIATCDVLYDLAFLLMDLWDRGLEQAANMVLNRCLWHVGEDAHIAGLEALPLFLSIRAALRAKISASAAPMQAPDRIAAMEEEARRYFDLARRFLEPITPRLVAIGGLSGTGKSTLAGAIAPFLGMAPGAVILRSDVERKQLAGVPETQRLPAHAYTPQTSAAVYDTLNRKARLALQAGYSVILDAVHARAAERDVVEGIAMQAGVSFAGIWLSAPICVMMNRVAKRSADASDADVAVVRKQLTYDLGRIAWYRLDAGSLLSDLTDDALALLAVKREVPTRTGLTARRKL
jgi:aminoglycoside phosphotransferase family enzyme/predicted kinase